MSFFKGSSEADTMLKRKISIRSAGLKTEKQFFGPRGVFAKAGHTEHLKNPGILGVDDPVYNTRQKFPKYSGEVSPLSAHGSDGVTMLVRRLAQFTKADHREHARAHEHSAMSLDEQYQDLITDELTALKRKGIEPGPLISGIVSEHFPEKVKHTLRQLATWLTKHRGVAWLHDKAARSRMVKNPPESRDVQVGFADWPRLVEYFGNEGWKPVGTGVRFGRTVLRKNLQGSLYQIIQKEAESGRWRLLHRNFLTPAAGEPLSLGLFRNFDEALIAANRDASEWLGESFTIAKNPITVVGNPKKTVRWEPPQPWENIAESTSTKEPYVLAGDGNVYGYSGSSYGGPWSNEGTLEEFTAKVNGGRYRIRWIKKNPITVVGNPKRSREVSVFDRHQLKIAYDTLKMPDAMVGVMGGPNKEEAREIIRRLTGKIAKENPPARVNATIAGVLYNRCREIRAEKTSATGLKGLYYHPFLERSKVMVLALDSGDILIHSQAGERLWKLD